MNCQEMPGLLDAYIDGELDILNTLQFERHLAECTSCRAICDNSRRVHASVRAQIPYYPVPKGVEAKIRASLRPESQPRPASNPWKMVRAFALATATLALAVLIILLAPALRRVPAQDLVSQQVVASHIRSLMANHLDDILSSNQHTVKPWFNGKIDFAPDVRGLAAKGFPLQGGRLDYLDNRPVVALIYKRREHTINLFIWPTAKSDSRLNTMNIKGYNLVTWNRSHMTYWAVSDLNAHELTDFVHDLDN